MKLKTIAIIGLFLMLSGCVSSNKDVIGNVNANNTLYLIYSPTCPHCHALINFLKKELNNHEDIKVILIKDGTKYANLFTSYNYSWSGGVPLLFAILSNNTFIAIKGFPTSQQNSDGYLISKSYEIRMCDSLHGRKVYTDGTYYYCIMPTGEISGNEYAIRYLLKLCEDVGCKKVRLSG